MRFRFVVGLFGVASMVGMSFTLLVTFFHAFFNDGKTIVYVNSIGEMGFEAVFLPVCFVCGLYGLYLFLFRVTLVRRN